MNAYEPSVKEDAKKKKDPCIKQGQWVVHVSLDVNGAITELPPLTIVDTKHKDVAYLVGSYVEEQRVKFLPRTRKRK